MESSINEIVKNLNRNGFAKSHVDFLLSETEKKYFKEVSNFYKESLKNKKIKEKINEIKKGNYSESGVNKAYEINHNEHLNEPLTLENLPLIQMYLSKSIVKIARKYLGENIRIRNPLAWIHPSSKSKNEIRSQKWHRDQEDYQMLKVFILFSDVGETNGPTQYIKSTNYIGKHRFIAPNMTWYEGHWSNKSKLLSKFYHYLREKVPLNYPIPKNNLAKATGKRGSVFFIDTNGLHKGGLVKQGIRLMTHCNYLKASAPMLQKGMILEKLNSNKKLFSINFNSKGYKTLNKDLQDILK